MANLVELIINGSAKNAVNSLKNVKDMSKQTRSELTLLISNVSRLGNTLYKTTKYSDEYTASLRLLKTTLGDTTKEATTFIKKLSNMSGLDENTLTKQTTKFVQLGESLNMDSELAEKFSENLSILTTKLSMLYNMDYTTMASTIQKAIQGSQVSLKSKTGIVLNELSEQTTLNAYGIDRQVSSLNDAEIALVKYATILRQVSNDSNVYQDAVNSLAWQKQILTAQVKRLANAVGQLLTPVFTRLVTVLNAVLMVITEIVSMLASLVGANIKVSNGVNAVSDGYKNLGASIGGASNTAKKSLRAFDKLNNITTPSSRFRWRWWWTRNR